MILDEMKISRNKIIEYAKNILMAYTIYMIYIYIYLMYKNILVNRYFILASHLVIFFYMGDKQMSLAEVICMQNTKSRNMPMNRGT